MSRDGISEGAGLSRPGQVDVTAAADALRVRLPGVPATAVVAGSGLSALEDALADAVAVPFAEVPGLPHAGVAGHRGRFVHGRLDGVGVLVQAGRFHVYEGHAMDVVAAPVRILAALGVERMIMTNAAGAIHPRLGPGDVVVVDDVINLMFRCPLAGPARERETRFPDMSRPLDTKLKEVVRAAAAALGQRVGEGVYAAVPGPAYETPAEVRMLARLGADLVGMSTVPEVIVAIASGLRCAVLSLVTNRATGLSPEPLSHEEVLEAGRRAGERMTALVTEVVRRLDTEGLMGSAPAPASATEGEPAGPGGAPGSAPEADGSARSGGAPASGPSTRGSAPRGRQSREAK